MAIPQCSGDILAKLTLSVGLEQSIWLPVCVRREKLLQIGKAVVGLLRHGGTTMNYRAIAILFVAGAFTAGCSMGPRPSQRAANTPPPSRVSGTWVAADGVAVSNFAGGRFSTTLQATGETVTEGS